MSGRYIIGIDEVGRGPLAGPVMVGVVIVPGDFNWARIAGVGDSKRVTEKNRARICAQAKELKRHGVLDYEVTAVSARRIDKIGIAVAIREALRKGLLTIMSRAKVSPGAVQIKLDGGLYAPPEFLAQETIIKGDGREPVIGLASIIAKVTRDAHMERLATKAEFAPYGFALHKGYGTARHRAAIAAHGLSSEHRASFCRNCRKI
jgi:ribonuclease HII